MYNQQKLSETPKSEYASPQDVHQSTQIQAPQFPMCQEIDLLKKQENHLNGDGEPSTQEKRTTVTLNKSEIRDTVGYSDLPARNKKSSTAKNLQQERQPIPMWI